MTLNLVPFVSVDRMMKLVHHIGIDRILTDLAFHREAKTRLRPGRKPRQASHEGL